jgi:acyl carrier protein
MQFCHPSARLPLAEVPLFGTRWSPVMSSTFDTVAEIIADTCDLPIEEVTPESHAIEDLGIDSLDFLDVAFAIDKAFAIKLPLEQWTEEVNEGKTPAEEYFVLGNLCLRIDELVAAKPA